MLSDRYVLRSKMEFNLALTPVPPVKLPLGYTLVPWQPELARSHALVTHLGFRSDSDAEVFPAFRDLQKCIDLLEGITGHWALLPEATLLIMRAGYTLEAVASIQTLSWKPGLGEIQNVVVVPEHRQLGLGRALVLGALHGCRDAGMTRVTLEATASNAPAMKLYEMIGFRTFETFPKKI